MTVPTRRRPNAHYGAAIALASELGMRPLVAHCHLGLGKLYRQTGKREQAHEHRHHRHHDVPRDEHAVLVAEGGSGNASAGIGVAHNYKSTNDIRFQALKKCS